MRDIISYAAADVLMEMVDSALTNYRSIEMSSHPKQALHDFIDSFNCIIGIYPDPAKVGDYNFAAIKWSPTHAEEGFACLMCENVHHLLQLNFSLGDMRPKAQMLIETWHEAGLSSTQISEKMRAFIADVAQDFPHSPIE